MPQAGQRSGIRKGTSWPVRRSRSGPSTWGITSPARTTSTQSPIRIVLLLDLVFVVERGGRDGDAADFHRLEDREWCQRTGAAHVHLDVEQAGDRDLGGELPGHRPPRLPPADHAEVLVQGEPIDLHDHAVGVERQGLEEPLVLRDLGLHRRQVGAAGPVRLDRETPLLELVQHLPLAGEALSVPSITSR